MRKSMQWCATLVVAALLAGCASQPKVRVDKDANTDFGAYKTFGWFTTEKQPGEPAPDSLVAQRVRNAIVATMQSKGYALNEASPDFQISYVLRAYQRPKDSGMRIGVGAGGGSGNMSGGVGLSVPVGKRTESVGAITLDAIDATRKAQVWTASYEMLLDGEVVNDAEAQKIIGIVLEKFPSRNAQ
jgi:hypothetical protein